MTAAHVVPKRLLVARELNSKLGVPSEPCAELIPSNLRSRYVGHIGCMGDHAILGLKGYPWQIPPCAGHGNP